MKIRHLIHNEHDLLKRFGQRFVERWKRLLLVYQTRWKDCSMQTVMKAASFAMVFYGAAVDGDAEVVRNFDSMIHGEGREVLMIDEEPVRVENDREATLVWDTAALMLEADETLPKTAQWAYNALDGHVWMAYSSSVMPSDAEEVHKPEVADGVPTVVKEKAKEVGATEILKIDDSVPMIPLDVKKWMVGYASKKKDPVFAKKLWEMFADNNMERYHSEEIELRNLLAEVEAPAGPLFNELILQKSVENEIGNIAAGGIGVQKDKNK